MDDSFLRGAGVFASLVFLGCGAFRLSRHNVLDENGPARNFVGLPLPAAAACIIAAIFLWPSGPVGAKGLLAVIALVVLLSVLMVSHIEFPKLGIGDRRGSRVRLIIVGTAIVGGSIAYAIDEHILAVLYVSFITTAMIWGSLRRLRRLRS